MAALNDVVVNSQTGIDGNSYTTAISNDKLTNDDFLKLLLEEMKMQDPTKPMDSSTLMDSQLKTSQIQANDDMSKSLAALTKSFAASSLSTAVGFMGKTIEDGSTDSSNGRLNSFLVKTIESADGEVFVNAQKQTGFRHQIKFETTDSNGNKSYENITYDANGKIYNADGTDSGINVKISADGSFSIVDSKYVFTDNNGDAITDTNILNKYQISQVIPTYSDTISKISIANITKVHG